MSLPRCNRPALAGAHLRAPVPARMGVMALLLALTITPSLPAQILQKAPGAPATLTPAQQQAREIYREMVEINTVDSVGSVTKAAQAVAARFTAAGFPAADIHLLGPANAPTKQNLIVRYRGKGRGKPILLLAHLDVVAANRSDWPRDPFTMTEQDGYFLGRGVADDKSMAAILTANLLRYKQEGWVPERDLILALTADEEGGGDNGVSWLIANHRDLIDAEYAINEGGGGTLQDDKPLFHYILLLTCTTQISTFVIHSGRQVHLGHLETLVSSSLWIRLTLLILFIFLTAHAVPHAAALGCGPTEYCLALW